MITWLIVWGLLLSGQVFFYAVLYALECTQEPQRTVSRPVAQNAPTGLVRVSAAIYEDDSAPCIDGEAVRL